LLLLGYIDEGNPSGIKKDLIDKWNTSNIIRYLGKVEDTREIIGEVDCVVLPSHREGVPRTLLEAASMEKPLIASDSIGCKDVVEDNYNGFLCNIKDSEDLADKMKKMLHLSKTELNVLGKNGRIKILKEFDEELVIGIYKNEINGLGIGKV
jgi:glycosyltransferase involved in cell wall biosynthesis